MPRRAYRINTVSDHALTTQCVHQDFIHILGVVKNRSEIALWQVPARLTDQRGLTYTFVDVASTMMLQPKLV